MLLVVGKKGFKSKQVGKSAKSPMRETCQAFAFRGGPLDDTIEFFSTVAIYRDATGTALRPRGSKVAAYLGIGGQIEGIYCLSDGAYVWAPAHRKTSD